MTAQQALRALVEQISADPQSIKDTRAYGDAVDLLGGWSHRTVDIVRWHFSLTDALLLAGCAVASLLHTTSALLLHYAAHES
jgi:hypothetical protein